MFHEERPTAFTASLHKMIARDVEAATSEQGVVKVLDHYAGGIEFYKKQFEKIEDPLNRAHAVHQHVDKSLADLSRRNPSLQKEIKCRAGCAFCCHNLVIANEEEAQLMLTYAAEEKIILDWEHIEKQAKFEGTDSEYFRQPKEDSRCAFLGDGNMCTVYEHRPNSCRKYLVASNPEDCDDRVGLQQVQVLADLQAELASSGLMDIDHSKVGPLAKMLMQAKEKVRGS